MDGLKRRLKDSVQVRLSATLSVTILIVALLAGVFAFVSAFDEALEMQDNNLRQVAALFERQQMTLRYPAHMKPIVGDNEETRVVIQYLADGVQAPMADDNALPLPLPTTLADGIATLDVGGEQFRVLVKTTGRGERIAIAQETESRDRDARESAWRGLLPFVILIPVLLLVVADLVRKLFRPIAELAAAIDQRDEQDLAPIDERQLPSEVRPFVSAINRLLGRVARSLDSQRRFVADAAHELRSPLTALSLQAERLAAAEMPAIARERLVRMRQGIDRSRNLIDQLLMLASAEAPASRAPIVLRVHEVYRQVLEDLLPLAESRRIDIGVVGDDCPLRVNAMDLFTIIKNLADNAIRYTPPGGQVDLVVRREGDVVVLQVRDNGPGIPVEERHRVFDAFYRVSGSQEVGSGLGLSIVKTLATRLGAVVSLEFAQMETRSGLCVSVILPVPDSDIETR